MATVANTPVKYYLDTPAVKRACDKDFKVIDRACKPDEPDKNGNAKKKNKGIVGKLSAITEKIDTAGKTAARYRRTATNGWMDDHCSGLWIKAPQTNSKFPQDLKDQVDELLDKLDVGLMDWLSMLMGSLDDIVEIAKELIPTDVVDDIMWNFGLKSGAKGLVGAAGVKTVILPALMGLWTAYDIYDTVTTLTELMGDKGVTAMKAFEKLWDIGDEVKGILADMVSNPAMAYANLLTLLALMDPCIRARKCLLVPYSKQNSNSGEGCCPGQTGHHLIPDSAASAGSCTPYNINDAPVMCLEGSTNKGGWGSHGNAHARLKLKLKEYRDNELEWGRSPNIISYDDMAEKAVDAVRLSNAALQCDKNCLLAQLKAYYNCPNGMPPKDGTGKMPNMPEPLPDDGTPDI